MKKVLSVVLAAIMMLAVLPVSVFAEEINEEIKNEITEIVADFIKPEPGQPILTDSFIDGENVSVKSAKWFKVDGEELLPAEGTFVNGTYRLEVVFEAAEDYSFAEEVTVSINGEAAGTVTKNIDGTVTATSDFECGEQTSPFAAILRILQVVKDAFIAVVKFFGAFIGLK